MILLFALLTYFAKADTISTLKVYYNTKLIAELTATGNRSEIIFDSNKYKAGDYLSINYNDDMPCAECKYEILVNTEDDGQEVWFDSFIDKYKPMKIRLENLVWDSKADQLPIVKVYLVEIEKNGKRKKIELFYIKIE